eukprot:TRINITY_DN13655_c0_g1_i1.p1 TRINITY_DN13655_c0_g1~~TRINITY_DN13655_c0_g1_i1.p1  ORF type:complete len:806 (+),score=221.61 TRINITY_DN13655_c0_g1_i1:147-2564(+)
MADHSDQIPQRNSSDQRLPIPPAAAAAAAQMPSPGGKQRRSLLNRFLNKSPDHASSAAAAAAAAAATKHHNSAIADVDEEQDLAQADEEELNHERRRISQALSPAGFYSRLSFWKNIDESKSTGPASDPPPIAATLGSAGVAAQRRSTSGGLKFGIHHSTSRTNNGNASLGPASRPARSPNIFSKRANSSGDIPSMMVKDPDVPGGHDTPSDGLPRMRIPAKSPGELDSKLAFSPRTTDVSSLDENHEYGAHHPEDIKEEDEKNVSPPPEFSQENSSATVSPEFSASQDEFNSESPAGVMARSPNGSPRTSKKLAHSPALSKDARKSGSGRPSSSSITDGPVRATSGFLAGRSGRLSKSNYAEYLEKFNDGGKTAVRRQSTGALSKSKRRTQAKKISQHNIKPLRHLRKRELNNGVVIFELENSSADAIPEEKGTEDEKNNAETTLPAGLSITDGGTGSLNTPQKKKRIRMSASGITEDELSAQERERIGKKEKVKSEIIETEKSYCHGLEILINEFQKPMTLKSEDLNITPKEIALVFSNLDAIHRFHTVMVTQLSNEKNMAKVFSKNADFLKMYTQYLNGYEQSIEILTQHSKNKKFQSFLAERRDSEVCKGLDIMSYLIMPVQRIPRYELLLRELKRFTLPSDEEFLDLQQAFDKIQKIAVHINENKRQIEQLSRLLEIESRLGGKEDIGFEIISHDRHVLREGNLYQFNHTMLRGDHIRPRKVILFTDRFLWTTTEFEFRGQFSVTNRSLQLIDIPKKEDEEKYGFEVSFSGGRTIFGCDTEKEKLDWIQAILEAAADLNQ